MEEIKNLKKAADRILKAAKKKENIIIYSDSDLDGVASAVIMKEALKNLGANVVEIYFPDREKEGYGITEKALLTLKKYTPALLIASDLGIGNVDEVKIAKKLGFEIIIIDHHEILEKVPSPAIVVDPKQPGDKYPFKNFAAAGLVFKVVESLFKKKMGDSLRRSFLELAAIATIADMMERKEDNIEIITEGINLIEKTWRPGLKVLFEIENSNSSNLMQRIYKINSLLNLRNIESQTPMAFNLLTASSMEEAKELSKNLIEKSEIKKENINIIKEDVEKRIFGKEEAIIFEGDSSWDLVLLGVVASIISEKYQKPTFLFKENKEESQGGIRSPEGHNVVEAMKSCSSNLMTYGGHPRAAGFRIKNKNLEEFKKCLISYFK